MTGRNISEVHVHTLFSVHTYLKHLWTGWTNAFLTMPSAEVETSSLLF